MATLDRWRMFLDTPKTLVFPRLKLIGRDHSPPIVKGSGEVRMPSLGRFEFTLRGLPDNPEYASAEIRRQQHNPYDALARFRLKGVDEEGIRWSMGYTVPAVDPGDRAWTFVGDTEGLSPDDKSNTVARASSTELVFLVPVDHPMHLAMARFVLTQSPPRREHVLEILGSRIRFAYDPSSGALSVTATHSTELPPTYTEKWLGEPLRILFGQLIFPRLVARNLGDGTTIIFVCRCPRFIREVGWAALWRSHDLAQPKEDFWRRYTELLAVIVKATGKDGHPNFEAHKITRLYQEIIQASYGTRWVWALTFASCIEGLANMLEPPGEDRPGTDEKSVSDLVEHINGWSGDARLKENAINAVKRTLKTTTITGLRQLLGAGAITADQLNAWDKIRNSVTHGSLVSPYSNAEEDSKLLALANMMHALTIEILRRSTRPVNEVA